MKLSAHIGIDCGKGGEVEGDTIEECVDKAWEEFGYASLCHQCAHEVDMGDSYSLTLFDEQGETVYEDSPSVDEAKRTKGLVDYIEELKAEIVKLKEAKQCQP